MATTTTQYSVVLAAAAGPIATATAALNTAYNNILCAPNPINQAPTSPNIVGDTGLCNDAAGATFSLALTINYTGQVAQTIPNPTTLTGASVTKVISASAATAALAASGVNTAIQGVTLAPLPQTGNIMIPTIITGPTMYQSTNVGAPITISVTIQYYGI